MALNQYVVFFARRREPHCQPDCLQSTLPTVQVQVERARIRGQGSSDWDASCTDGRTAAYSVLRTLGNVGRAVFRANDLPSHLAARASESRDHRDWEYSTSRYRTLSDITYNLTLIRLPVSHAERLTRRIVPREIVGSVGKRTYPDHDDRSHCDQPSSSCRRRFALLASLGAADDPSGRRDENWLIGTGAAITGTELDRRRAGTAALACAFPIPGRGLCCCRLRCGFGWGGNGLFRG
jgi:hypothetical protein